MMGEDATRNYQSLGLSPHRHGFHHRGAGGSALLIANTRRSLGAGTAGQVQHDTPSIGIDYQPNYSMAFPNWTVVRL